MLFSILNLTPFQGGSLQWDVFLGFKTPGLRPVVPLGQWLRRQVPFLHLRGQNTVQPAELGSGTLSTSELPPTTGQQAHVNCLNRRLTPNYPHETGPPFRGPRTTL